MKSSWFLLQGGHEVTTIHLHLDNDAVGHGAAQGIMKGLEGRFQVWNQPPRKGKDLNDLLQLVVMAEMAKKNSSVHLNNYSIM